MEESKNELVPMGSSDIIPAEFIGGSTGYETLDPESIAIPFLKVCSSSNDELKPGNAKFIKGLQMGKFFSPVTKKVYGEKIRLIMLKFYRNFAHYDGESINAKYLGTIETSDFKAKEAKGQIFRKPGKSYYVDNDGHRYVDNRNFIVLDYDDIGSGPMIYTMSSTGIKPSKTWLTLGDNMKVRTEKGAVPAPMWLNVWELEIKFFPNDSGDYYQVGRVDHLGFIPATMANHVKKAFDSAQAIVTSAIQGEVDHSEAEEPLSEGAAIAARAFGPRDKAAAASVAASMKGDQTNPMF